MKTRRLLLTLLTPAALVSAAYHTNVERLYTEHSTQYKAVFSYDDNSAYTPVDSAQLHYNALTDLYRAVPDGWLLIGTNIVCAYTVLPCYENSLPALFYNLAQQPFVNRFKTSADVGLSIHFSEVITNSVIRNVLYTNFTTALPVIPPFTTNSPQPKITGTVIVDWLLNSRWLSDADSPIDSRTHIATNIYSSNLVARVFWNGQSNQWTLESYPIITNEVKWKWNLQQIYNSTNK